MTREVESRRRRGQQPRRLCGCMGKHVHRSAKGSAVGALSSDMPAVLIALLLGLGACGPSPARREPLKPPAPETETLTLRSRVRQNSDSVTPERSYDIVVELHPSGRWRYAWRGCGLVDSGWNELHGTWRDIDAATLVGQAGATESTRKIVERLPGAKVSAWFLVPDDPRRALDSAFAVGELPELSWGPAVAISSESPDEAIRAIRGEEVKKGAYCYVIPLVDPNAGRFLKDVILVLDPREEDTVGDRK